MRHKTPFSDCQAIRIFLQQIFASPPERWAGFFSFSGTL